MTKRNDSGLIRPDQVDRREVDKVVRSLLAVWGSFAVLLVAACILASCASPRVVEHIIHQRDTSYIERTRVDSTFRRDSVFVKEKGDTVYVYKEKVRDRYRTVRDTVRLVRVDTVAVERVKEVEVEKPLTNFQRLALGSFWYLCGAVLLLLLWILRKPLQKILLRL